MSDAQPLYLTVCILAPVLDSVQMLGCCSYIAFVGRLHLSRFHWREKLADGVADYWIVELRRVLVLLENVLCMD